MSVSLLMAGAGPGAVAAAAGRYGSRPPGIVTIPQTGQWVLEKDSHLSRWAEQHGNIITDPHLFRWIKPHVEGVKVAWDVGAAIGDTARQYLDWGMQVVAIEPNPLPFACLEHNCPEARCLKVAASDAESVVEFAQSENIGASRIAPGGEITVITVALDTLSLPDPGFIKIDIEGYEVFALRGMRETLKRCKPIVFVEVNKGALAANGHSLSDIMRELKDAGYTQFQTYPEGSIESDPQYDILAK